MLYRLYIVRFEMFGFMLDKSLRNIYFEFIMLGVIYGVYSFYCFLMSWYKDKIFIKGYELY